MKIVVLCLTVILVLSGCATGQVEYYAAETARHNAEAKRWEAMGKIAETGDTTVKTVAMVTMGSSGQSSAVQATAAPRSPIDQILQAASIFVPAIVQGYGIRANTQLGMRQSDNATATAISTNGAFVGLAGKIQAPQANNSTTNYSTSQRSFTDSHAISGSYNPSSATDSHAVSTSNSNNPVTDNSNRPVDNSNKPIDNSVTQPAPVPAPVTKAP